MIDFEAAMNQAAKNIVKNGVPDSGFAKMMISEVEGIVGTGVFPRHKVRALANYCLSATQRGEHWRCYADVPAMTENRREQSRLRIKAEIRRKDDASDLIEHIKNSGFALRNKKHKKSRKVIR